MNPSYNENFNGRTFFGTLTGLILFSSLWVLSATLSYGEDPFFSIALSRFSNEQDAAREKERLINSGHNAFYKDEESPDDGTREYQIYIEKYDSREDAENEARVLRELELISDYTIRKIGDAPPSVPGKEISSPEKEPEVLQTIQPSDPESGKALQPPSGPEKHEEETVSPPEVNKTVIDSPPDQAKTEPEAGVQEVKGEAEQETESPQTASEKDPDLKVSLTANNPGTEPPGEPVTESVSETVQEKIDVKPEQNVRHEEEFLTGTSLQVGAFKDEANAAALNIQLRDLGKNSFYRLEKADGKGEYYRLYITGYSSLREAIKDAKTLLEDGIISGYSRVLNVDPIQREVPSETVKEEGTIFLLHISSNRNESNAAENVARLKKDGHKAFYVHEKDPSASWYRVYIGGFKNEAEAREKGMELLEKGIVSYFKPLAIDRLNLND